MKIETILSYYRPIYEIHWDPITGCSEVSEGCKNCFGVMYAPLLQKIGYAPYRNGNKFEIHERELLRIKKLGDIPATIFPSRMSDIFQPQISDDFIKEFLSIISSQPQIFDLLTKQADRLLDFEYPNNLVIGVTAETPEHYNRIAYLKKAKAKYKKIALTPLISPHPDLWRYLEGISAVQVYEEIGPMGRPWSPAWLREIECQCFKAGVYLINACGAPKVTYTDYIRSAMALRLFDPIPGDFWGLPTGVYPRLSEYFNFCSTIRHLSAEELKARVRQVAPEFIEP